MKTFAVFLVLFTFTVSVRAEPLLYFADNDANTINRMDLNGNRFETIIRTGRSPQGIDGDLLAGTIYFSDLGPGALPNTNGRLMAANLDGSNIRPYYLAESENEVVGQVRVDSSSGQIWWTDEFGNRLLRGNLNGPRNVQAFFEDSNPGPLSIDIDSDAGMVYWSRSRNSEFAIERANIDGTNRELVSDESVYSIWIDNRNDLIYGADFHGDRVFRSGLDGEDVTDLLVANGTRDVRRFGENLFWSDIQFTDDDQILARILKGDLDGSNAQVLYQVDRRRTPSDPISFFIVPEVHCSHLLFLFLCTCFQTLRRQK